MGIDCEEVKRMAGNLPLIEHCDVVKNGALRMATPFRYPDGSQIDLFLQKSSGSEWLLSDLGQTTSYLLDLNVKPWTTKKRKQLLSDICQTLGIAQDGGQFQIALDESRLPSELQTSIVRLAQGSIRIADLAFTQRLRTASVFREEVEEFLVNYDLPYEENIKLKGQFENTVEVDFRVQGKKVTSLVQTLSTANAVAAHGLSNEVFRRWYDLNLYLPTSQFLTVYDTNTDIFRDDDLRRLSTVSTIIGYPANHDELLVVLAA